MGNLMELRRRMIMAMNDIPDYLYLPSAYERIPYVIADGYQAVRTIGYVPIIGDEFHIRFKTNTNGANGTIISAGAGTYQVVLIGGFSGGGWYCKYFSSTTYSVTPNYSANTWYDLDINSTGTVTTNGQTFSCPPESELDGTATDLFLCERRNWSQQYNGSISEFWIKNNGKYKVYLIPCIRKSDQKVGLYNTINKTFHSSANGRNEFIAGT